jgi:hypothetical protein
VEKVKAHVVNDTRKTELAIFFYANLASSHLFDLSYCCKGLKAGSRHWFSFGQTQTPVQTLWSQKRRSPRQIFCHTDYIKTTRVQTILHVESRPQGYTDRRTQQEVLLRYFDLAVLERPSVDSSF